jgi:DNA-binding transcriptional regulator/RsmH inhibitor MraZ
MIIEPLVAFCGNQGQEVETTEEDMARQNDPLLLGREFARTDVKARVLVPKPMREALGSRITMTTGMLGEIRCYRDDAFVRYMQELMNGCSNEGDRERLDQHVFSVARQGLEFDPSGRLTIRDDYRKESQIDKATDVVIVWRTGGWMEIWNRSEYEAYRDDPAGYKEKSFAVFERMSPRTANE